MKAKKSLTPPDSAGKFVLSLLVLFLFACSDTTTPVAQPVISWRKTESPLFPDTWPPTAETIWVSYTFAYGTDPALMDALRVSPPLVKTEWRNGVPETAETGNKMEEAAVQGIVPLDEGELAILTAGTQQISAFCLSLTGQPDSAAVETQEMLAFYSVWFRYNSAFLDLIRDEHNPFIEWVETASQP